MNLKEAVLFLAAIGMPLALNAEQAPSSGPSGVSGIASGVASGVTNSAGGIAGGTANSAISGALGGGVVGNVVGSTAGAAIGGAVSDTVGSAVSSVAGDALGTVTGGLIGGGGTRIINGTSTGSLASPGNVSNAAQSVSDSVMQSGKAVEAALNQQAAATTKLADTQNIVLQTLAQQQALMNQVGIADQNYGSAAMAPSGCGALSAASAYSAGKSAAASKGAKAMDELNKWSGGGDVSRQDAKKRIDSQPPDAFLPSKLLPPSLSIPEADAEKALEYIKSITDAAPEPKLTGSLANTKGGKDHERVRMLRAGAIGLPEQVQRDIMESHLATIEYSDWAQGAQAAGGSTQGGKVSIIEALQRLSDSRLSNPQWIMDLHAMGSVGVMREIAIISALNTEIQMRQLRMTNNIAALMAMEAAHSTHRAFNGPLGSLYDDAVSGAAGSQPAGAGATATP